MWKAVFVVACGVVACGPRPTSRVEPSPRGPGSAAVVTTSVDAGTGGATYGGATYGGATYGGAAAIPARGGALTWTVTITDNATGKPLAKVAVTAVELTYECKTREIQLPRDPDNHHRPHSRTETYDCKGGKNHVTQLTDANGSTTFKLAHSMYELGAIKHKGYFATDLPDPVYQRAAVTLVKTSITNGGASRLTQVRLIPESALKVTTDAQAETLALAHPIVKKCLAAHPQLTHAVKKPSLLWRVQFLYAGANSMVFESTVDSLSGDVGFLGCWDPCCAVKAPSRFEKRLIECAKLRGTNSDMWRNWDCDTLARDWVELQDFLRRQGKAAEIPEYEKLYRAYEAGETK